MVAEDARDWHKRRAALEAALAAWELDDEEHLDLDLILREAADLYRIPEHTAEVIWQGMMPPMRAPTFHDSAMYSLSSEAVDESGILWADGDYRNGRFVTRNACWVGGRRSSGCWCWGQQVPNPNCPHHGIHANEED